MRGLGIAIVLPSILPTTATVPICAEGRVRVTSPSLTVIYFAEAEAMTMADEDGKRRFSGARKG